MTVEAFCIGGMLIILAGLFLLGVFHSASKGKYTGDSWRNEDK